MKTVVLMCLLSLLFSGCSPAEKKRIPVIHPVSVYLMAEEVAGNLGLEVKGGEDISSLTPNGGRTTMSKLQIILRANKVEEFHRCLKARTKEVLRERGCNFTKNEKGPPFMGGFQCQYGSNQSFGCVSWYTILEAPNSLWVVGITHEYPK
jgi:hypothetical protein